MVSRWRGTAAIAAVLTSLALGAATAAAAPNLTSIRNGWITDGTTPSLLAGTTLTSRGDLLVVFNNSGDGAAGASAYTTRSSDEGATWTRPALLRAPSGLYRDGSGRDVGSVSATLGLQRLSDGTLLLPFIETVNRTNYTDRESQSYVARSTDDGVTWSGLTTPIRLPTPLYFNATYGQVVELASGTLVMPVWSAVDGPSTPGGVDDPEPWQAGVLRSFDSGRTWTDYRRIAVDDASLPPITNPWGRFPSNVTETAIRQLRDGRLLALMRSDTNLGFGTGFWASWSSDDGVSWSDPVWTNVGGTTHDMASAPCSASLSGTTTKLIMGATNSATNKLTTRVSFDGGVKWLDPVDLVDPSGALAGRRTYPNFVPLSGNRLWVTYGMIPSSGTPRLAYNILQDASGSACQTEADAAASSASSNPTLYVERADASEWPWPYSRNIVNTTSSATLGGLVSVIARQVTCSNATALTIRRNGVTLDQTRTLAALGVGNGAKLVVNDPATPRALRVGFADYDDLPALHRVQSWDTACDTKLAFDYHQRSLALDVPLSSGQTITSVSLRDSDASTRLTAGDYELWTSADGHAWTSVSGWSLAATTSGGRLTHTFSGLALTQRYVKVTQRYADTAFTFVINSSRNDVTVTTSP